MKRKTRTQKFDAHRIECAKENDQYYLIFTENRYNDRSCTIHRIKIKISFWQFGAIVKMIWQTVQDVELQTKSLIEKLKGISL